MFFARRATSALRSLRAYSTGPATSAPFIDFSVGVERRVYFNGFPSIAKNYDIRALFSTEGGPIEWMRVSRKPVQVTPKGGVEAVTMEKVSGFVQFKDEDACEKAKLLNGKKILFPQGLILDGRTLSNRTIERSILVLPARAAGEPKEPAEKKQRKEIDLDD